jgi:hypothetical protein
MLQWADYHGDIISDVNSRHKVKSKHIEIETLPNPVRGKIKKSGGAGCFSFAGKGADVGGLRLGDSKRIKLLFCSETKHDRYSRPDHDLLFSGQAPVRLPISTTIPKKREQEETYRTSTSLLE